MTTLPYDPPTDPERSNLMRRVRQRGTKAEDDVAGVLCALDIRFRRNVRTLPGSPDFANKSRKWALFVNGCFWHHHAGCTRATTPTRNRAFWRAKFEANVKRDRSKTGLLRRMGFSVLTVWECETRDKARLMRRFDELGRRR